MNETYMDLEKQIEYWRQGADDEMEAAEGLFSLRKYRQALFFAHLSIEKIIKAHITIKTKKVPPKIHNLGRLAEIAELSPPEDIARFLKRFDIYQIETRYPNTFITELKKEKAASTLAEAKRVLEWIRNQFKEK